MNKPMFDLKPHPLFDTYEAFKGSSIEEYNAARPSIRDFLDRFPINCSAYSDLAHATSYLLSYSDIPTTFKSYRGQVERLLLWCWIYRGKSVLEMARSDVEQFMAFVKAPAPAWIGDAVRQRFIERDGLLEPNEKWRPFGLQVNKATRKDAEENAHDVEPGQYAPARASVKQILVACNSFFDFMVQNKTIEANPFKAIKGRKKYIQSSRAIRPNRSLSQLQWSYLIDTAEAMANESPKHERTLFIVVSLFAMYLRVSDLVGNKDWTPTMGSFFYDLDSWWYKVIGKGNVEADISVKNDYLPYLSRYRKSRNLTPLPQVGESAPLLTKLSGGAGITDRHVRNIVQGVFDRARLKMLEDNWTERDCDKLKEATLHWLRHTGASFDAPHRSAKDLQLDLRHTDLSTTQNIYYNVDDAQRASSNIGLGIRR